MGRRTNHPPPERPGRFALRVAVTDRCNLRCAYCMPEEGGAWTPLRKLLGLEDLATLVRWIHGIYPLSKVRITGGEPTLRRGLPELVKDLREIPGSPEITLTTNGTRLATLALIGSKRLERLTVQTIFGVIILVVSVRILVASHAV